MKYNDNGEIKNIIIKSGDTLPIGTEVEFDGETIPDGWEEVEEKEKVLWENSNADATFNAQTVNLNDSLSNYNYYEVIFKLVAGYPSGKSTGKVKITTYAYMDYVGGSASVIGFKREITGKTNTTISFGDGTRINTNAIENARCIPIQVIGYK